jgi:3,4-dihydroxy 2-butanone 4-phosphate synthase
VREGLTDINSPASAALELCRIAQLRPAMVRCELVHDSGALANAADGVEFAHLHGLTVLVRRDLVQAETQLARIA